VAQTNHVGSAKIIIFAIVVFEVCLFSLNQLFDFSFKAYNRTCPLPLNTSALSG